MTEPALTVSRIPAPNDPEMAAKYPLAFQAGVIMLSHLIEGDKIWSGCTKPQRAVLNAVCRTVLPTLMERGELHTGDLPHLPESVTTQMRSALTRRGLAVDGRITGRAVYAWYWTIGIKERQALRDAHLPGEDAP